MGQEAGHTHKCQKAVRLIDKPPNLDLWQICFHLMSLGRKCYFKGSRVRISLTPEDCVSCYKPLDVLHAGISPNFSLIRMNWKLVYRKSGGFSQQTHSSVHLWTLKEKYELLLVSVRTGKDVCLDIDGRRLSSFTKIGNRDLYPAKLSISWKPCCC